MEDYQAMPGWIHGARSCLHAQGERGVRVQQLDFAVVHAEVVARSVFAQTQHGAYAAVLQGTCGAGQHLEAHAWSASRKRCPRGPPFERNDDRDHGRVVHRRVHM
eukprot:1172119-Prorocentrum_minimum.AAC.1